MKIKYLSLVMLLALSLGTANAAPIVSTVTVGDKEWAQVNLFTNLSWNDINAVCPESAGGVCQVGGTLNGWTMTGWTWASVDDVGDLFAATTPHAGGISHHVETSNGSSWATDFFDEVGFSPTELLPNLVAMVLGVSRTLHLVLPGGGTTVYMPTIQDALTFGGNDIATTETFSGQSQSSDTVGAWFYRPTAQVPEPSTVALLGLGLVVVGALRRGRRLP